MVTDLIVKAKQIEYLINSLPKPESEEEQVSCITSCFFEPTHCSVFEARRLQTLEAEMEVANAEYIQAVNRASQSSSFMITGAKFYF